MYHITAMTLPYAEEISCWAYPGEYNIYSFEPSEEGIEELLCGDYVACLDENETLIGYFCFGASAQIPTVENFDYSEDKLDLGLGLRPDLCGKGFGQEFMGLGLEYAKKMFPASSLRLTVAAFNQRAISLYQKLGFKQTLELTHRFSRMTFILMEQR